MKKLSGVELLEERKGEGIGAAKGDRVVFNMRLYLNQGDEVPMNALQSAQVSPEMLRTIDGTTLIDRGVTLGRRQIIAGVEHALSGMNVGGYRKVRIGPHLAYRDQGVPGLIPPDAVLIVELWLREVGAPGSRS